MHIDHTTIFRWVQSYAPDLEKLCRSHVKICNDSWKVDGTSIKVKRVWIYLYRVVDSEGNTGEFLLSPTRDAEAAQHFFVKALGSSAWAVPSTGPTEEKGGQTPVPADGNASRRDLRVITVDKNAAYPKATAELKASGILPASVELRQVKYVNNLIEQDHRAHCQCRWVGEPIENWLPR